MTKKNPKREFRFLSPTSPGLTVVLPYLSTPCRPSYQPFWFVNRDLVKILTVLRERPLTTEREIILSSILNGLANPNQVGLLTLTNELLPEQPWGYRWNSGVGVHVCNLGPWEVKAEAWKVEGYPSYIVSSRSGRLRETCLRKDMQSLFSFLFWFFFMRTRGV